ncbi:PE-PPE domain-containing protein [Mycolicibacterium sp. 22603]|uniref:PE-PPE domain-containing protein n=1 Tax=Mycolicibacterium sp. 22603 TaxID=3453950 RepID=UPI003F87E2DB
MSTTHVVGLASVLALAVGLSPAAPVQAAGTYYLEGTRIGNTTGHQPPQDFVTAMRTGAGLGDPGDFRQVDYPAAIGPFSSGGLQDPTWNTSVERGLAHLGEQPIAGDTVFGYSQGAVVASAYKAGHPANGVDYVLVENPGRPNGGIMARFGGLYVPLLDITFSGPTPVLRDPQPGAGSTVDIARQYDGWADFPTYPLNLLATANAILGIIYLHGGTQDLDATALSSIDTGDPRYYQQHGDTTYYLIPTERLPLLMPLRGILPDLLLDAIERPLRALVELGYDRSDYSKPTGAQLLPPLGAIFAPQAPAQAAPVAPAPDPVEEGPDAPLTVERTRGLRAGFGARVNTAGRESDSLDDTELADPAETTDRADHEEARDIEVRAPAESEPVGDVAAPTVVEAPGAGASSGPSGPDTAPQPQTEEH